MSIIIADTTRINVLLCGNCNLIEIDANLICNLNGIEWTLELTLTLAER